MSRRGLLGGGVLAGVLAASGVPVVARPRGGVLRLAVAGPVPHGLGAGWDTRGGSLSGLAVGAVAEALAEIGPGGELLPGLARGWESDGAARDWRLRLDPEARFHDGSPFQPQDAILSILRHREDSPLAPLVSRIEEAQADGSHAIRLRLAAGDPDLPLLLADPRLAMWREGLPDGVGTGLYRVAEGAPLRLLRVMAHRRDGQAGFFDAVEVTARPEPEARLWALLSGEADAADPLPAGMAEAAGLGLAGRTPHGPGVAHGASDPADLDGGRIAERWWRAA